MSRFLLVLGLVCILAGGALWHFKPTTSSDKTVLEIGGFSAKVQQQKPLPDWLVFGVIGFGTGLVFSSFFSRR